MTSATDGFSKVAEASLEKGPGGTVRFPPVEATFVKTRLLRNGRGYAWLPYRLKTNNPGNLVCSAPLSDFIIASAPGAPRPALATGQDLTFPLTGVDTNGVSRTVCIGLAPPREGELAVVSALSHASKARKNLEIILDASGSMKMMLGKETR